MLSCACCSCPCAPLDTGPVAGARACAQLAERMHAEVCFSAQAHVPHSQIWECKSKGKPMNGHGLFLPL